MADLGRVIADMVLYIGCTRTFHIEYLRKKLIKLDRERLALDRYEATAQVREDDPHQTDPDDWMDGVIRDRSNEKKNVPPA